MLRKSWLLLPAISLIISCGGNKKENPPVKSANKTQSFSIEKDKKLICSNKTINEFLPEGNRTIVYKSWYNGACRVVAFYPQTDKINHLLWYNLFIYRSADDNKLYAVYGAGIKGGKFQVPKEELETIKAFKERYWKKLLAKSIKMMKNFKVLEVVGNGTRTAYLIVWDETYESFKDKINQLLKSIVNLNPDLKIKVLAPHNAMQVFYKFKLPFNVVFFIKDNNFIPTKYYLPIDMWAKEKFQENQLNRNTNRFKMNNSSLPSSKGYAPPPPKEH